MARENVMTTGIYTQGSSPNTRVAISQKNKIYSKAYSAKAGQFRQVGVLSTFDWSEDRAVDPVRGVGWGDKIAELVPGVTGPATLTLNRTLLYTAGIVQELGYRGGVDGLVRSLRQHRWPFDVVSELVFSELVAKMEPGNVTLSGVQPLGGADPTGTGYAVVTFFEACWLNNYSVSFPSDSAIVIENCSAMATDVTDGSAGYQQTVDSYGEFLEAGNNPFAPGQAGAGSILYSGAAAPTAGSLATSGQ